MFGLWSALKDAHLTVIKQTEVKLIFILSFQNALCSIKPSPRCTPVCVCFLMQHKQNRRATCNTLASTLASFQALIWSPVQLRLALRREKKHFKSSVTSKPQTSFHPLASDVFCHALSLLFCALKHDLFFPYVFILLLMFHALPLSFHIVTLLVLKAHVRAGFVFLKRWMIKADLRAESHCTARFYSRKMRNAGEGVRLKKTMIKTRQRSVFNANESI